MKKILIILFAIVSFNCISQTYDTTKHYIQRGSSTIIYEDYDVYAAYEYNSFKNPVIVGYYRKAKILVWEQEHYDGVVYEWIFGWKEVKNAIGNFWKPHWEEIRIKI
jgi:hypothetical protein